MEEDTRLSGPGQESEGVLQQALDLQRQYVRDTRRFVEALLGAPIGKFPSDDRFIDAMKAKIAADSNGSVERGLERNYQDFVDGLAEFHSKNKDVLWGAARELRGARCVVGGSYRIAPAVVDVCTTMALYSDTTLLPDPLLPWIERDRREERFRLVNFALACYNLAKLEPLVNAECKQPIVFVFPSYEKTLEDQDEYTRDAIRQMIVGFFAHYLSRDLGSMDEVVGFATGAGAKEFRETVNRNRLLLAPGASEPEPFEVGAKRYRDFVREWRSDSWLTPLQDDSDERLVFNCISERLAPQFHVRDNASCFSACPLIWQRPNWHYFTLCAEASIEKLQNEGLVTSATVSALASLREHTCRWLGNVPMEDVVRLREEGATAEFRERIARSVQCLHQAELRDIDTVASEVGKGISSLLAEHDKGVEELERRFKKKHGITATISMVALAGTFLPWLAPYVGTAAPLVLTARYVTDKLAERAEKAKAARSLTGILVAARG